MTSWPSVQAVFETPGFNDRSIAPRHLRIAGDTLSDVGHPDACKWLFAKDFPGNLRRRREHQFEVLAIGHGVGKALRGRSVLRIR